MISYTPSAITIGIDPEIHLGPVTVAWHGLTIAIGVTIGGLATARYARERGLQRDPLFTIAMLLVLGALVGGRLFYVAEHGDLLRPGDWLSNRGFTFNGGFLAAAIAIGAYVRLKRLSVRYLDAVAAGLPLGVAVGRIGDVINGEHHGPATTFFLGVRNTHPDALVPNPDIAYHSGGLYEVLLASLIFAIVWPLRHRLDRPTAMVWSVLGLFAVGRFFEFFLRSDSETLALGLSTTQWTSLALVVVAALGAWATSRQRATPAEPRSRDHPRTRA